MNRDRISVIKTRERSHENTVKLAPQFRHEVIIFDNSGKNGSVFFVRNLLYAVEPRLDKTPDFVHLPVVFVDEILVDANDFVQSFVCFRYFLYDEMIYHKKFVIHFLNLQQLRKLLHNKLCL